ncbi:MAG: rod shape-determining protein MreD [Bacteroidales bacterium]|nr:rod shape-determining protein MreD [Bacteroidales bacterium]
MSRFMYVLSFFLLLLFQVLVSKSIALWGIVTPMAYILFILILPFQMPKWQVVVLGFVMGISVDLFTGIMGQHAAASLLIAFLRTIIVSVIPTNIKFEDHLRPILWDMHFVWYFQYVLYLTLIHHVTFFLLDSMSVINLFIILGISLLNTVFTVLLIFVFQVIFFKPSSRY